MNKVLSICFCLLLSTALVRGQQIEKTLVKSFNLHGNRVVLLDVEGPVQLKSWEHATVRVQMNVILPNSSTGMLKALVQHGRYNLQAGQEAEMMKISAPGLRFPIKMGDKVIAENISYVVFAPENVEVKVSDTASSFHGPVTNPNSL